MVLMGIFRKTLGRPYCDATGTKTRRKNSVVETRNCVTDWQAAAACSTHTDRGARNRISTEQEIQRCGNRIACTSVRHGYLWLLDAIATPVDFPLLHTRMMRGQAAGFAGRSWLLSRRWNLFLGRSTYYVWLWEGLRCGLGVDMGGRHASYRANPGRPLLLLPALRAPFIR
jgi:hypothetical protein